jgi:hypothetical protein
MVQLVCGMTSLPTPDDAADALAVAICIANRVGPVTQDRAGVLDRAAVAPIERGDSAYDRAVRDAIAREKRPADRPAS